MSGNILMERRAHSCQYLLADSGQQRQATYMLHSE